jgi:hypothetical protein
MSFHGCDTRGPRLREKQKAAYDANPNFCQFCGKKIEMGLDKLRIVRLKKFCNYACAAASRKKNLRK